MFPVDAVDPVARHEPVAGLAENAVLVLILDWKELVQAGLQALNHALRLFRHAEKWNAVEVRNGIAVRIAPFHPFREIGSVDR